MLASELMSLNVEDLDMNQNNIKITNQRGKSRVIPMDKRIKDLMKDYIDSVRIKLLTRDKEKALFLNQRGERLTRQGFWQIVQSYADQAGIISKVTPRSIRHSFAVHRLKNGSDIHNIQEILGHAHVSTTKSYRQS
jgi:integrase/recombinase XerD